MKYGLLLFSLFFSVLCYAQKTIIYCGKLIDVKNTKMLTEMSIVINSDTISDVIKGYVQATASDKVIDLKKKP